MKKIILTLLVGIFLISIVSAADISVAFPCGGDEQATFLCFGDEQLNFWGVIKRDVKEIIPLGIIPFDIFKYPNYLYVIIGILLFLLFVLLIILFVKKKKKQKKKRFKNK